MKISPEGLIIFLLTVSCKRHRRLGLLKILNTQSQKQYWWHSPCHFCRQCRLNIFQITFLTSYIRLLAS